MRHCYECKTCTKCFHDMKACNRHESKCAEKKEFMKHEFVGGNDKKHQSMFDKIFKLYNKNNKTNKKNQIIKHETLNYFGLTKDDLFHPHEIAYDFEAILKNITTTDNNHKLQLTTHHVPVGTGIIQILCFYAMTAQRS